MYQLVILEDNKEHVDLLVRLLENFPEKHRFQTTFFLRPESFITYIKEQGTPDIFLTDIDFGENSFNGIQLVSEQFQPGNITQVIYVTGFINYCTRVYETEHIYFLTKPVESIDLYNALVRAISNLDQAEAKSISLSVNGCVIRILTDTINYIESDKRKLKIVTDRGVIEAYASLASITQNLGPDFLQCHKSFVINMKHIAELRSHCFILLPGETIPISQKRYKAVRTTFLDYLSNRL